MNDTYVNGPASDWTETEWATFRTWLKGMLTVGEAYVTFTKKNGTERVMRCSLKPEDLPPIELKEDKKDRKQSTDSLAVYDLDSKGWRSFIIKSVKRVNITL